MFGLHTIVKIVLTRNDNLISKRQLPSNMDKPCYNYTEVEKSTLSGTLPSYFDGDQPWKRDQVSVLRSESVTAKIEQLLDEPVPGLSGATVRNVINHIDACIYRN